MRKRFLSFVIVATLLLTSGCHRGSNQNTGSNVVSSILITGQSDTETIRRYYNTPDKIRLVLLYIRSVSGGFTAQVDPTTLPGSSIRILTVSADNTQKVYQQKSDCYFQSATGTWQEIDPEKGAKLWKLLKQTPSDPE